MTSTPASTALRAVPDNLHGGLRTRGLRIRYRRRSYGVLRESAELLRHDAVVCQPEGRDGGLAPRVAHLDADPLPLAVPELDERAERRDMLVRPVAAVVCGRLPLR